MANAPFDWSQFTQKVYIEAPVEKVYRAWTDDKIVSRWFTVKTEIVPRSGGRLYFEWLAGDKLESKVIKARKNRLFSFPFGSKGEIVEVTFSKQGTGTVCQLHQFNMQTTPRAKVTMHVGCREGWAFFLTNLKAFLEHGIDLRSHDVKRSYRDGFINS